MYILYIYYTYIHVVMFMYCVLTFNVKARDICCCTVMVAKEAVSDPSL